ncbi:helix-turn-helix domain-containing protein [Fulvivirga sp.]|uniref:helix-turn-helix domain-containing protein n=1 Tax=Fulvivirga sp. TaxID=1931237 RepID=UPI0032F0491A
MDLKSIGRLIQIRRKFLKVSQQDLSEIAGISERTLRDIEKGLANPELETLSNICHALGLEIKVGIRKQ